MLHLNTLTCVLFAISSIHGDNPSPVLEEHLKPLADPDLTSKILHLVNDANKIEQLYVGITKATKAMERVACSLLVLAADGEPHSVLNAVHVAQKKKVPYIFVPSKDSLGRAGGWGEINVFGAVILSTADPEISDRVESAIQKIKEINAPILNCTYWLTIVKDPQYVTPPKEGKMEFPF